DASFGEGAGEAASDRDRVRAHGPRGCGRRGVILVEQKPEAGREQPVSDGMTIGREECDVNLIDPEVSRRHAGFRAADGSFAIEDLGSTNGTFVNDSRITGATVLSHGDTLRLGGTVWTVQV